MSHLKPSLGRPTSFAVPVVCVFRFCGWDCLGVDWCLDSTHDLSSPACQGWLAEELTRTDFIRAAFDCSTKSRAHEIPRVFADGSEAPPPLRSEEHPLGLPGLSSRDARRVKVDNEACAFVRQQIQLHRARGGASLRENPQNIFDWFLPTELDMWSKGHWQDFDYDACVFQGARCKRQRLRHNIEEIDMKVAVQCRHIHSKEEWKPFLVDGKRHPESRRGGVHSCSSLPHCGVCFVVGSQNRQSAVACPPLSANQLHG